MRAGKLGMSLDAQRLDIEASTIWKHSIYAAGAAG